eukprot:GHRR01007883.1.p1 GENE.GHRR01007883.1~~GHRR01007883.1.p1  ORF type:complete len:290 (+),score=95.71 GHRR01007883.1:162-1031(+)
MQSQLVSGRRTAFSCQQRCKTGKLHSSIRCHAVASNNGNGVAACPKPAETARTVADLCQEGSLCTVSPEGYPMGAPVSYKLDKDGNPVLQILQGSPEAANIERSSRCSLLVQPISYPARRVAAVALQGTAATADSQEGAADGTTLLKLTVESCLYYGGLDNVPPGREIAGDDYRAAEADLLRHSATDLIHQWNSERAEDIYRIVSGHLGVPVIEMLYAELLWMDRLGLYVRAEMLGRQPQVVRVPFYRAVLDQRDARSVVTMASHISWEGEKRYVPPPIQTPTAAASNN